MVDAKTPSQLIADTEAAEAEAGPPRWVKAEDMPSMPRAWYWSEYPGSWEWYSPERNATRSIDHGRSGWNKLIAKRYWGPWVQPPG